MRVNTLSPGDTIGIIAPSRPIYNIKKEVEAGISTLQQMGFKVKRGQHLENHFFYSAGTPTERISDLHKMFADPEVNAIICATGGSSANQLIELVDFKLIKNNPKIFIGYSDITILLLAINAKTGLPTYYGPTAYEMSKLTQRSKDFLFQLLGKDPGLLEYPREWKTIRKGKATGKLVGGILSRIESFTGTAYLPKMNGAILFWEDVNSSPAAMDFNLQALRLSGVFEKISGMIIGHLSECIDKKYPNDNRPIEDIILERTSGFNFPIMKVEYFGHDIDNFYTLPIGAIASMNGKTGSVNIVM